MESRTAMKSGALAGVSAALTFALLIALAGLVRFSYLQIQERKASAQEMLQFQEQEKVNPDFMASAQKAADLQRGEHAAASKGWAQYKAAHDAADPATEILISLSKTAHEMRIASALHYSDGFFDGCITSAIHSQYPGGTVEDCERVYPLSRIDQALK